MEAILRILRSLAPYHGTCPDLHQGEVGYYAMVNGQAQWVQLPQERGHQAFDPDTYIRAMQDGSCTPIFSSINIGPLREWPRILFPELASYSIDVFRVVAVLYEMFLHRLPSQQHGSSSAVQIPTEIQLARIAIELLNSDNMRGAGETITAIVSEIASHDITTLVNIGGMLAIHIGVLACVHVLLVQLSICLNLAMMTAFLS